MKEVVSMKEKDTRARLLGVAEILKDSDEKHPFTSDRIIGELKRRYNIEAERKAIGLDIKALVEKGEDIISCNYKRMGYFQGTHQFEGWEVKILMDAVAQAKFLTPAVTGRLIDKLLATTSVHLQKFWNLPHLPPRELKQKISRHKTTSTYFFPPLKTVTRYPSPMFLSAPV